MNREELNLILDLCLSWGCEQLEKDGFFHPFAFTLQPDGSLQRSGELTEDEKLQDPEKIIAQIQAMLSSGCRQNLYKAAAIVIDVKVKRFVKEGFVKAVEVQLEHEDGTAVDVFLPYRKNGNRIEYGAIFSSAMDKTMFV